MAVTKEKIINFRAHLECEHHTGNDKNSMMETIDMPEGYMIERQVDKFEIVFVISGKVEVSRKSCISQIIGHRKVFFLAPESPVYYSFLEPTYLVVCRLDEEVDYCRRWYNIDLSSLGEMTDVDFYTLPFKRPMTAFIENMLACFKTGLACGPYLTAKFSEMFFLFRAYYTGRELAQFFRPMLGKNLEFRTFVYKNIYETQSIRELAKRACLSEVTFRKKFIQEFGKSPIKVIMDRKKALVLRDIQRGSKPFKQICEEYEMPSQSYFTKFCLKKLGDTPSNLRRKARVENTLEK